MPRGCVEAWSWSVPDTPNLERQTRAVFVFYHDKHILIFWHLMAEKSNATVQSCLDRLCRLIEGVCGLNPGGGSSFKSLSESSMQRMVIIKTTEMG
jgi:hypothetical protein